MADFLARWKKRRVGASKFQNELSRRSAVIRKVWFNTQSQILRACRKFARSAAAQIRMQTCLPQNASLPWLCNHGYKVKRR
jgi:hypothetical protein